MIILRPKHNQLHPPRVRSEGGSLGIHEAPLIGTATSRVGIPLDYSGETAFFLDHSLGWLMVIRALSRMTQSRRMPLGWTKTEYLLLTHEMWTMTWIRSGKINRTLQQKLLLAATPPIDASVCKSTYTLFRFYRSNKPQSLN